MKTYSGAAAATSRNRNPLDGTPGGTMIRIGPQAQSAQEAAQGACVECASPYLNPAHVLSPPRHWLEALVDGGMTWEFFRLRYKALLRTRSRENPEAFYALLEASE